MTLVGLRVVIEAESQLQRKRLADAKTFCDVDAVVLLFESFEEDIRFNKRSLSNLRQRIVEIGRTGVVVPSVKPSKLEAPFEVVLR